MGVDGVGSPEDVGPLGPDGSDEAVEEGVGPGCSGPLAGAVDVSLGEEGSAVGATGDVTGAGPVAPVVDAGLVEVPGAGPTPPGAIGSCSPEPQPGPMLVSATRLTHVNGFMAGP
jgi:hypothetical protein